MTETAEDVRERVYDVEESAETTFRIEDEILHARVEDKEAKWRVDDIAHGEVALVGFYEDNDVDAASYARLPAQKARRLGNALIAASEYAEEQK
jgi:hypothetical protein